MKEVLIPIGVGIAIGIFYGFVLLDLKRGRRYRNYY